MTEQKSPIIRDSIVLPYGGGMIWCEELDGLGRNAALVREKFDREMAIAARPSSPGWIALHLEGTHVDAAMAAHMAQTLASMGSAVQRVAVIGPKGLAKMRVKRAFTDANGRFALAFFTDYEEGKRWLANLPQA